MNFTKTKKIIKALLLLLLLSLSIFFLHHFFFNQPLKPKQIVLFKIPDQFFPEKYKLNQSLKKIKLTLTQKKVAADYFIHSCSLIDKANFVQAKNYISMAIARNPNEKKYYKVLSLIEAEIDNRKKMKNIISQLSNSSLDDSWRSFELACNNNYLFFSRYAKEYSFLLKENNQLASASSILLAIKYRHRKRGIKN
jgi:hypothetical protein